MTQLKRRKKPKSMRAQQHSIGSSQPPHTTSEILFIAEKQKKKDRIEATKGKVYLTIRSAISVFVVFNQSSHRYNFDRWRFCKSLIHSHLYRSQATYHTGHITFRLHIHHLTFILGGGGDGGEITGKNAGNPVAAVRDGFSTITSVKPLDIGFSWWDLEAISKHCTHTKYF